LAARDSEDVPRAGCGPLRKSTRSRWRALTLIGVYILFGLHYLHWYLRGRTLTPVEPSEAMQTFEQGLVNAGFLFFALAILSTLMLGRWFCGWGCHVVALQDLCTWLLKKLGLRLRPFRSRLLVFVPLLAALYMFVWPSVLRVWHGEPRPPAVWYLTTYDFWATFPGPWMSLLTLLVCGFLIVYLLGNKGFCTYACPYGGIFGVADLVAPGKIRVTDACDGCGHCTASCTSNVRVHEEVRHFGMVVDLGCMKCTDCISVCPKDALYFGFGRPTLARGKPRTPRPPRQYDYSWPEELVLAAFFLAAFYAFRGLYDAVPFLLSLGLAAISAFVWLQALRLFYTPAPTFQRVAIRRGRRMTPAGGAFFGFALALAAFVVHATLVQYHARAAEGMLEQARRLQEVSPSQHATAITKLAQRSFDHLDWVRRFGLFPSARTEAQLGAVWLFLGERAAARAHVRRALEIAPGYAAARHKYAELVAGDGDLSVAVTELERAVHDNPALADARHDLIAAARRLGRLGDMGGLLDEVARRRPYDDGARRDLAAVLAETGGDQP
jgi:polyferredoxin